MKYEKGQKLREWLNNGSMTETEVTTARVFLMVGFICGVMFGIIL